MNIGYSSKETIRTLGYLEQLLSEYNSERSLPSIEEKIEPIPIWYVNWITITGEERGTVPLSEIDRFSDNSEDCAISISNYLNKKHLNRYHYPSTTRLRQIEIP